MRRTALLTGFVAVLLLAVVATGRASSTTRGRVTGLIRLCGGPAPGRCFLQNGTVSVIGPRNLVVAKQTTRHAQFLFLLAPGQYTLLAKTDSIQRERTVVVKAHQLVHANIVIPIVIPVS
jgi:hypothetical protein